jgi:hypothetical protein
MEVYSYLQNKSGALGSSSQHKFTSNINPMTTNKITLATGASRGTGKDIALSPA